MTATFGYHVKVISDAQIAGFGCWCLACLSAVSIAAAGGATFVLKVINATDSSNVGLLEAQNQAMLRLSEHSIRASCPVKLLNGNYVGFAHAAGVDGITRKHAVRLLAYLPGQLLVHAPKVCFVSARAVCTHFPRCLRPCYTAIPLAMQSHLRIDARHSCSRLPCIGTWEHSWPA